MSATVITRADVLPAGSVDIVGPATDTALGGSGVVTGVFVTRGDEVGAGARLVEVSGRPVFVFALWVVHADNAPMIKLSEAAGALVGAHSSGYRVFVHP